MIENSMHQLNSQLAERTCELRERELLVRIGARDREALHEFYLLHYHRLARFLRRMTCHHDLVDEMVNDTLIVVWEKAGDFRGDSRVSTWIMGIAYRRGLNLLRAECHTQENMVLPTIDDRHRRNPVAEQSDLTELMECALVSLSPDHRAALELAYYLGHSCEEIAAIMECPIDTVRTRVSQVCNKLRALVQIPATASAAPGAIHIK
jgi:RNA polymerase sigma-70 factor (ECF subfamily)